jgi:hypothetical protein
MEDIRTYLDTTDGYHKGEASGVAIFSGLTFVLAAIFWMVHGLYFLYYYGRSFEEASGGLTLGAPGALMAWSLASFRFFLGVFLGWLGLLAWDSRRGFLYWIWFVVPAYIYFWWQWVALLDPEFRAQHLALGNLTSCPIAFALGTTIAGFSLVLVVASLSSWAFKPSASDFSPLVVAAVIGMLWFGATSAVQDLDESVTATATLSGIAPFDLSGSGIPILKLIALSPDALLCQENMDHLKEALERRIASGMLVRYSSYSTRPGGERLIRMLQQGAGLKADIQCPEGGWYHPLKETGVWRCSVHGNRLPKEERTVGGLDRSGEDPSTYGSGLQESYQDQGNE